MRHSTHTSTVSFASSSSSSSRFIGSQFTPTRCRRNHTHPSTPAHARVADPFADPSPLPKNLPREDWRCDVRVGAGKRSAAYEGETLEVSAFTTEDVSDVATLLLESGMQGFPTERRTLEVYLTNAVPAFPFGTYLIGRIGGEVVATVGVSFNQETRRKFSSLAPPSDAGYLSDLTVATDKRGAGLGVAMLEGAEEFARAMDSEEMWLHVALKKPKVISLYQNSGYRTAGVDPGLLGWRGRLLMKRRLAKR